MPDERFCRECFTEPAGDDGFCSDYCADKFDRELYYEALENDGEKEEGGEA